MTSTLFALDIGTRSVVGIILKETNNSYHVADVVSIEHQERSMIDGQIHNILSVANVIIDIKEQLEEKHGPLKRVSVAAAGRALITNKGEVSIDLSKESLISTEDVNRLELLAVQKAQQKLLTTSSTNDHYYCVGYSVLHYQLEDQKIGNLIDQSGESATVEVIATFLPQVVVESLLAALKRADLEMEALTLEPIAAIQVLIPPSMRRLNVALVDIGAGTSDIAIADEDTIIAYGMVPAAGDKVTEALSNEYLLDFPIAEQLKRKLSVHEEVTITDILGFEQVVPAEEVQDKLRSTIQDIAKRIAEEIIKLNNAASPKAVILVGGGSMTPKLSKEISAHLSLPEARVAIRGLEALSNVSVDEGIGKSPDLVTPIGIAIAAKRAPIQYMSVNVNGRNVRLFELKEMTIGDALLASNLSAKKLYGKPGHGISISFNGKNLIIPGGHGKPSQILLNGKVSSSKSRVTNHDQIEIIPGEDGHDAQPSVNDLIEEYNSIQVIIEDEPVKLETEVTINGKPGAMHSLINDRDRVIVSHNQTLEAALKRSKQHNLTTNTSFIVVVNGRPIKLSNWETSYLIGNLPVSLSHQLKANDQVSIQKRVLPTVCDIAKLVGIDLFTNMNVIFNDKKIAIRKNTQNIFINEEQADASTIVQPNDRLAFKEILNAPIVFSDLFAFTSYELPENIRGDYKILRNDETIGFNDLIFGGDRLEIVFSNE